jgi:hypothetical protein
MKSSNISKIQKDINKEITEKKYRKNKKKYKKSPENTNENHKLRKSGKNLLVKNYKVSPHQRKREKTVINKSSIFKDKNIKTCKMSLFNKNSQKKLQTKDYAEKENIKGVKYKGMSHKYLLMGLEFKEKEDKKENIKDKENVNNSSKKKLNKKN